MLIQFGAFLNMQTSEGKSALDLVCI